MAGLPAKHNSKATTFIKHVNDSSKNGKPLRTPAGIGILFGEFHRGINWTGKDEWTGLKIERIRS